MNSALNSYKQTQVETVNQGEIVVLLYDGAIRFLNQAKDRIEKKDFGGKGVAISRALDIIAELDSSLNMEKGGELSKNLHSLYLFASTCLLKANMKLDVGMIDHVIHMMEELKYSFEIVIKTPEAKQLAEEIRASRSNSTFVARSVTNAPSAGVGKSAANSAYQTVARNAGVQTTQGEQSAQSTQATSQNTEVDTASVANFLAQQAPQSAQSTQARAPVAEAATIQMPTHLQNTATPTENVGGFDLQASLYNLRQKDTVQSDDTKVDPQIAAPVPQKTPNALNNPLSSPL